MGHDTEAAYASSEIADILTKNQRHFFGNLGGSRPWSIYAGRESGSVWPLADGVIQAENSTAVVRIAFEYKRPNEGVHGILTAIGQSYAYLEKGYDAAIMAIPSSYSSHSEPGNHVKRIVEAASPKCPISIYTYTPPDLSATRPFLNRLSCVRDISLPDCSKIGKSKQGLSRGTVSTLWAHVREGMSHPDVFFRFCQSIKAVTSTKEDLSSIRLPDELIRSVEQLAPGTDPYRYLSNTVGETVSDRAWRHLWFHFMFWQDLMPIYRNEQPYEVNDVQTKIRIDENHFQSMFAGRSDSIKSKCVARLNADNSRETMESVWCEYAKNIHSYAHSYREVIDSGLDHIGFVGPDGNLTDLGYKYVEACERYDSTDKGTPLEILRGAFLQNGKFAALLHYIYKYSEEKFHENYLSFTTQKNGQFIFDKEAYINWLDDIFVNTLHISRKSTLRAGGSRRPLQAELTYMNKLGIINSYNGRIDFRIGLGLSIDWPKIQSSLLFFNNL
jgi:hypothetical protein